MNKSGKNNSNFKHGHNSTNFRSTTYTSWHAMKSRCRHDKNYKKITVCKRWENFLNFLADMGEKPKGASIDRIDNSKGYSPKNCRWATKSEQQRNTKRSIQIKAFGKKQSLYVWAEEFGLKPATIIRRINRGWSNEEAVSKITRKYEF